jgi:hypothetical protein
MGPYQQPEGTKPTLLPCARVEIVSPALIPFATPYQKSSAQPGGILTAPQKLAQDVRDFSHF